MLGENVTSRHFISAIHCPRNDDSLSFAKQIRQNSSVGNGDISAFDWGDVAVLWKITEMKCRREPRTCRQGSGQYQTANSDLW